MYSVVLMMALSGSAEAPEFLGHGCQGKSACQGRLFGGSGCKGTPVRTACQGGGLFSGRGCSGSTRTACQGGKLFGGHGCSGGGLFQRHGCAGTRVASCSGSAASCSGSTKSSTKSADPKKMPTEKPVQPKKVSASATLVVTVPVDAALIIDGQVTKSTSARRTFVSPDLEPNADYVHELTASVVIDGRTITQTQQVTVRAGQIAEVPFNFSAQSVASR